MLNGRNRLPAAQVAPLSAFPARSASDLELLNLLEVARRGAYEVARRLDLTSQIHASDRNRRGTAEAVIERALAFEESIAALMVALEDQPRRINGTPRL